MDIILTKANLYVEPGLKLIVAANSAEIHALAKKIQRSVGFELPSQVLRDDGQRIKCRFNFQNNEENEGYFIGNNSIDLMMSPETAARSVELLGSLGDHSNDAFQFLDLADPKHESFAVIVQLVK